MTYGLACKNFYQGHNQTPKGKFPEDFSSIHPAVQEELSGQDFVAEGRTDRGVLQVSLANKKNKSETQTDSFEAKGNINPFLPGGTIPGGSPVEGLDH